ncbi:MAG TPA: pyridoxamine 5'-phosphate oxidase family protein [Candidatus Saccharimonadales bacterium]|nr:pyridoxamine 5'-phosphate oxidase family protein [Candidatus Saccharimonadales bacterium]
MSRAKEILDKVIYITIATSDNNGQPWNTPVFAAYDKELNFYWGSSKSSQHSKNIEHNPNVFLVIYDSSVPAGTGEGVYVLGQARQVTDKKEIKAAHKLLQNRRPEPYWELEHFHETSPIALYKAVPEKVWMNDGRKTGGIYEDILKEIEP